MNQDVVTGKCGAAQQCDHSVPSRASNEDYSKVPEDFTITKGQAALRHYANQPAHPL